MFTGVGPALRVTNGGFAASCISSLTATRVSNVGCLKNFQYYGSWLLSHRLLRKHTEAHRIVMFKIRCCILQKA